MSENTTNNAQTEELKVGMELKGTVKQLELYGAFVDIGTGQDALLHISQLGQPNIRNIEDIVKVGQEIEVYVLKVDKDAERVALSLEKLPTVDWKEVTVGMATTGSVVRIEKFGAFIDIGAERPGMVHVSEMAEGFVKNPNDVVKVGDSVEVRVLKVNRKKRQIDLSMKSEPEALEIIEDEEDEEELPTAMAMAFHKAMDGQGEDSVAAKQKKSSKRKKVAQDDIIARTLQHHNSANK